MARTFKLTWQAGTDGRTGRWRKKYGGRTYYFDGGRGKYDQEAYESALANWERAKLQIDAAQPREHEVTHRGELETWEKVLSWSCQNGDREMASIANERVEQLRKKLTAPVLKPLESDDHFDSQFTLPTIDLPDIPQFADLSTTDLSAFKPRELSFADRQRYATELNGSPSRIAKEIWADRLAVQDRRADAGDASLERQIESFLLHKANEAENNQITVGRLGTLELHLRWFQGWFGKTRSVHDINSHALMKCRLELLSKSAQGKFGRHSAKHYFASIVYFVRWLWRVEVIDALPRILDKRGEDGLSIAVPAPQVEVFTKDEITRLLGKASERTKLFLLLMLNCGMTQKDVADLVVSEVEWDAGRVIRKRSKTSLHENVPVVNYALWPETFRLLKKFKAEHSNDRVLLNLNGSSLWQETRTISGEIRKNDNIKNAYERLRRDLGIEKSLKSLKKTSATLIRDNERFRGLEGLFLGHAPQSMADKHYTVAPQRTFDEAILWLGKELSIVTTNCG